MTNPDNTNARQLALAWAERTLNSIGDGILAEDAVAAARLIQDTLLSPEDQTEKPVTFDTLTEAEQEAYIGVPVTATPVTFSDGTVFAGFYMGKDNDGDHYILREGLYGRLSPQYVHPVTITPAAPNTPRALIPGFTYTPGEAPADALGWFTDDRDHGTVIVLTSQPDEDDEYYVVLLNEHTTRYSNTARLTNWRPHL